jgi:hypothetical protein
MNDFKSKASKAFVMLSLTGLVTAAIPQQVNAFGFSDLDPTNPNSAVREAARETDPTNPNSAVREAARELDPVSPDSAVREFGREVDPTNPDSTVRELGREVDPTNPDSTVRELGREVDPTNPDSAVRELGREVDPSKKVDGWIDDRIKNAGEATGQQAEEIGQTALSFAIKIAMVIGGLVSFLFVLSILRGLMKRIVT